MNNQVIWKEIPGYEGLYSASNTGLIRAEERLIEYGDHRLNRTSPQRIKKQTMYSKKYYKVTITSARKIMRQVGVHRLVCWAFIGPQAEDIEVRHINGNGLDNRIENLCYGTKSDNMRDAIEDRTFSMSEWHPCAKLTKEQVVDIRTSKEYYKDVALKYDIHPFTVHKIRRNKVRNHDERSP